MNGRISLILFGILVTLTILCAAENSEESSLSEEVSASRLARSAEAGRKKNKSLKKKRRKNQKSKKAAKKAAKKSKKNKRKTKKNRRKAKKNKKKVKKNKRNQKRKSNNQQSNEKNKKNKSKDNKERSQDGKNWPLDGHCVECAASGMYRWKTVVANFAKQKNRIEKQAGIASNKKGKNTVFAPIALKLMDVGGGNKSALKCANSTTSDGAKQLTNLTQTLFDCETKLNEACAAVEVNMTFVEECAKDIELFENMTKDCYDLSKSDTAIAACYCWINDTYRDLGNKIKSCKIEETMNVTDGLKECKKAFSTCRQAEDDAVSAIAACSVSEETLKTNAATLAANVNITASCSTKVAGITGSGAVPRAAASTCSEFITLVDKLATIILEYPASPEVCVVGGYILASADPTCTNEEKASLLKSETSLTEAAKFLVEAYSEAQANLLEATGSTLSSADVAQCTTVTVTTAAARSRMRGFKSKVFRH